MSCKGTLCNIQNPCPNEAQDNGLCYRCEREAVDSMHHLLRGYGLHRLAGELEIEYSIAVLSRWRKESK